jgi:hypothetical protein
MFRSSNSLLKLTLAAGFVLSVSGCAQPNFPNATYDVGASPQTGSAQGINTHNSEPMPSGMVMRNNGLGTSTQLSTDPTTMPTTGSAQGVNPHDAAPMARGMTMSPSRSAPLRYNADGIPQTGSAQGLNSHNSEPMPSGMVMPPARGAY